MNKKERLEYSQEIIYRLKEVKAPYQSVQRVCDEFNKLLNRFISEKVIKFNLDNVVLRIHGEGILTSDQYTRVTGESIVLN